MNHNELASDLARHLREGSRRITWQDMQLGPSGSPRPDVYTMEPTFTRLSFEAFEVKVSVSDFRRDVTAGKWQSYLKYANSVTFAVPAGLIDKKDVPSTCGLMVRHEKVWRYVKKPVRNVLTEIPWQAWVKLLLDGVERADRVGRTHHFSTWAAEQKLAAKFGAETARLLRDIDGLPAELERRRTLLETQLEAEKQQLEDAKLLRAEQAERDRRRLAGDLLVLGRRLGLAEGATEDDLHAVVGTINRALGVGRDSWDRRVGNPLTRIVESARQAMVGLEQAAQMLDGVGAASSEEAASNFGEIGRLSA